MGNKHGLHSKHFISSRSQSRLSDEKRMIQIDQDSSDTSPHPSHTHISPTNNLHIKNDNTGNTHNRNVINAHPDESNKNTDTSKNPNVLLSDEAANTFYSEEEPLDLGADLDSDFSDLYVDETCCLLVENGHKKVSCISKNKNRISEASITVDDETTQEKQFQNTGDETITGRTRSVDVDEVKLAGVDNVMAEECKKIKSNEFNIKQKDDTSIIHSASNGYASLDFSTSRNVVQQGNTRETTKDTQSSCDIKNALGTLIEKLSVENNDWIDVLNKISTILRTHTIEREQREITQALIELKFISKLETFLDCKQYSSILELKSTPTDGKIWLTIKKYMTIIWIACDRNVNFCQHVLVSKVFMFLVSELRSISSMNYSHSDVYLFTVKSILGICHNISRHVPNSKWRLRNEGMVTILRILLPSEVAMVRLKSLIVLSYILSEAESDIISSDDDNFVFIFQVLSDALVSKNHQSVKYGMSVVEVLKGVNNLAINDENKLRIVSNGALPLFEDILGQGQPEEVKVTIMTLWSLAFHHYNKRKMREIPGIMKRLYELQQCDNEEICHAARGTFWELENMSKTAIGRAGSSGVSSMSTELHDANKPHIMISYQWDSQPIMVKVKDRLRHAGYKVWMDVEHMTGSTLEAMALAVEKAAVVLVCMSQKYKDSPNCRTEAEYVYRLRKDFVPLRLQSEYVPDGWLGILVGTRLYFDIYTEGLLDIQLPRLIKELRDRGKISPTVDTPDHGVIIPQRMISREAVPLLQQPIESEVIYWSTHDVNQWLKSLDISELQDRCAELDGSLVLELQTVQKTAPEYFYTMLQHQWSLSTVMILKLSKALRCLK